MEDLYLNITFTEVRKYFVDVLSFTYAGNVGILNTFRSGCQQAAFTTLYVTIGNLSSSIEIYNTEGLIDRINTGIEINYIKKDIIIEFLAKYNYQPAVSLLRKNIIDVILENI